MIITFISASGELLSTLSTDAANKLNILGHDCDTLGMDTNHTTQVGIFEKANEVGL